MPKNQQITYKSELLRKTIHLSALLIPICYYYTDYSTALYILVPFTAMVIGLDLLIHFYLPFRTSFLSIFGSLMRRHELSPDTFRLNGASWVALSASISIAIFPKSIAINSFTIVILSDLAAALIGRKFGRTSFLDKSLQGTLAFIIMSFAVTFFWSIILDQEFKFIISGFCGGIIAGLCEAASARLKVDDNLVIPIAAGSIHWILYFAMGYLS